jgi:hypothetical protein
MDGKPKCWGYLYVNELRRLPRIHLSPAGINQIANEYGDCTTQRVPRREHGNDQRCPRHSTQAAIVALGTYLTDEAAGT